MSSLQDNIYQYHKDYLAKMWIKLESFGSKTHSISSSFTEILENDGRKRNKVLAALARAGYVNMVDGKLHVTSKAFNEVSPWKPDFLALLSETRKEIPAGIPWENLSPENHKYIIDHKDEYQFFYAQNYGENVPIDFGTPPPGTSRLNRLMVKDSAFSEAREQAVFQKQFEELRKQNLAWGLEKLGLVNETDVSAIKTKNPFDPFNSGGFKTEPANWVTDLDSEVEKARSRIDEQTKRLEILTQIKSKMSDYGGWDKFLTDYDNLIVDELKKQNTASVDTASV